MPDFNQYLMRHGESWVQEIVEQIERVEGSRPDAEASLEARWDAVMSMSVGRGSQQPMVAA